MMMANLKTFFFRVGIQYLEGLMHSPLYRVPGPIGPVSTRRGTGRGTGRDAYILRC